MWAVVALSRTRNFTQRWLEVLRLQATLRLGQRYACSKQTKHRQNILEANVQSIKVADQFRPHLQVIRTEVKSKKFSITQYDLIHLNLLSFKTEIKKYMWKIKENKK